MADVILLAGQLGRKVQPADDFYKFTELELIDEINEALIYLDPELNIEDLTKRQEILVLYKAMSSCYYGLATKHAENIRFRIENDEYHGQDPYNAYMALGKKYEDIFDRLVGGGEIQVNTVTRTQTGTGLKAPYYWGDTP